MFGKLKKVLAQIETIWAYIDDHKDDIAQLQKELAETQKTLKALTASKAPAKATVKKTTK
jgi:peptidoglycan hydrolase CwlO-like protein